MSGEPGERKVVGKTFRNHNPSSDQKKISHANFFRRSSVFEGMGNREVYSFGYTEPHTFHSNQATYNQSIIDKRQPEEIKSIQIDRIIELLDDWTLDPEELEILTILENSQNIDTILSGLKSRGYLKKLFSDIHGKEHRKLIGVLAKKRATVKPDHSTLEQIFSGTVEGTIAFSQGTWESFTALFESETWIGMANFFELVFKATNLHYGMIFPQRAEKAREQLKQIASSIKDQFVKEWENAKSQGRESEIVARWTGQGILEVASMFVGVGAAARVVKSARGVAISAKFIKLGWTLEKVTRVLNQIENFIPDLAKKMGKKSEEIREKVRKWRQKNKKDWPDHEIEELIEMEQAVQKLNRKESHSLDSDLFEPKKEQRFSSKKDEVSRETGLARLNKDTIAWLKQKGLWEKASKSLPNVGDDIIAAIEHFKGAAGFDQVVRDFLIGGAKQEGARFVLRYALHNFSDKPKLAFIFEMGSMTKPGGGQARFYDLFLEGIRYEFKSVKSIAPSLVKGRKSNEFGQLQKDIIESMVTNLEQLRNTRWVFNKKKMNAAGLTEKDVAQKLSHLVKSSNLFKKHPLLFEIEMILNDIVVFWSPD